MKRAPGPKQLALIAGGGQRGLSGGEPNRILCRSQRLSLALLSNPWKALQGDNETGLSQDSAREYRLKSLKPQNLGCVISVALRPSATCRGAYSIAVRDVGHPFSERIVATSICGSQFASALRVPRFGSISWP